MVYLDTNVLVYLLEKHEPYSSLVADELDKLRAERNEFITSAITIAEFMAGTRASSPDILRKIPNLRFSELDERIATRAAVLQKKHKIQIGDALHLATAIEHKVSLLFTNDKQLAEVAKKYISIKTL